MSTYRWHTDVAQGAVCVRDLDTALAEVVAQQEWAEPYSASEARDIADGAWLTIYDEAGIAVLRRGERP